MHGATCRAHAAVPARHASRSTSLAAPNIRCHAYSLQPTADSLYILHSTSYILHPTSYIIHHTSYILHSTSFLCQAAPCETVLSDLNYTVSERETIQDPVLSRVFVSLRNGGLEWHRVRSFLRRTAADIHLGPEASSRQKHAALQVLRSAPSGVYGGPLRGLSAAATQLLEDLKDDPEQMYCHVHETKWGWLSGSSLSSSVPHEDANQPHVVIF